jgi:hypothetical protein
MHLVAIGDAQENDWVSNAAASLTTDRWWMGLNDMAQEGVWAWEDGSPVTFTSWEAWEPNDAGGEDCGQLLRFYPEHTWNDEPCDQTLPFVCEADALPVHVGYSYSFCSCEGETLMSPGDVFEIYNMPGGGAGHDVARCYLDQNGLLRAYNLDSAATTPVWGAAVASGCSEAVFTGFVVTCCVF